MPLRLLGLVPDLESLPQMGGRTFAHYAGRGVAVTVACAGGAESGALTSRARSLGIQGLMLLDYRPVERDSPEFAELFADIMRAVRPHVVVVAADDPAILRAAKAAFDAVRQALDAARPTGPGSAALPAKLYHRFNAPGTFAGASTAVSVGRGPSSGVEAFRRVFPSPWVTGVVESDLFAGLSLEADAPGDLRHRLAS